MPKPFPARGRSRERTSPAGLIRLGCWCARRRSVSTTFASGRQQPIYFGLTIVYHLGMSTVTDEEAKANIAANIRRLLAEREPPENQQKWLAEKSGESEMRISLYARGEKMAGAGVLTRIAAALGVSVDELVDDPPPENRRRRRSA